MCCTYTMSQWKFRLETIVCKQHVEGTTHLQRRNILIRTCAPHQNRCRNVHALLKLVQLSVYFLQLLSSFGRAWKLSVSCRAWHECFYLCVCASVCVCVSLCVCIGVCAVPGFCNSTGKREPSTQACLCSVSEADLRLCGPFTRRWRSFFTDAGTGRIAFLLQQHSFIPGTMCYYWFWIEM